MSAIKHKYVSVLVQKVNSACWFITLFSSSVEVIGFSIVKMWLVFRVANQRLFSSLINLLFQQFIVQYVKCQKKLWTFPEPKDAETSICLTFLQEKTINRLSVSWQLIFVLSANWLIESLQLQWQLKKICVCWILINPIQLRLWWKQHRQHK